MPPSRRSSSSRSSRSRSSSSRSSSRRHSSSSHSSSSSYRSSSSRSTVSRHRARYNQPTGVPAHILAKAISMNCRNHTYVYYKEPWVDSVNGTAYKQGYYDENGKYYDADSLIFKRPDGSYNAHFVCEYCGNEAEFVWTEGVYPTCKSCGAQMNKEMAYVDDIIQVESYQSTLNAQNNQRSSFGIVKKVFIIYFVAVFGTSFLSVIIGAFSMFRSFNSFEDNFYTEIISDYDVSDEYDYEYNEVTNIDIYGTDIYLDKVDDSTYVICEQTDDYEKHLTWDYGADSYYDYDSNCYLWYNTDVSPNLWQYWYEDIAGSDYYGWMECEGDTWYIEISDTEWEEYTRDTAELWHIQNEFD